MKFFVVHGQIDKCQAYIDALTERGHTRVGDYRQADFVLRDFVRRQHEYMFRDIQRRNIPTFTYPHAALSVYMWDGLICSYPTVCNFTFAEGQRQILEAYGYGYPSLAAGWSYSPLRTFEPSHPVQKILFAPKHPNGNRALIDDDQVHNQEVFERLRATGLTVTVYYGHELRGNGLKRAPGCRHVKSKLSIESAIRQIERADLVVAHDTFAYVAIALGKPTLMFTGDQVPHVVGNPVRHWESYREIAKYPLDVIDEPDTMALIERASAGDEEIRAWKARMIGRPFDAEKFVSHIESYFCGSSEKSTGSLILNEMDGIRGKSYLELGIADNRNFDQILCRRKASVDINGKATFTGTTDEFFQSNAGQRSWDVIFIDANHDYAQVLRDFNHAVACCREWILVHDMIPPSARYCAQRFCSDSYKLLYYLMMQPDLKVYPIAENFGLTLVRMPARRLSPPRAINDISYESFAGFIAGEHLYCHDEIVRILNEK